MNKQAELYEALAELWSWSVRNGKSPSDNNCTLDTWNEVEEMVTKALSSGAPVGRCFACQYGVRNVMHAEKCPKAQAR